MIKGSLTVSQMLDTKLERDNKAEMCDVLELNEVLERQVTQLSGGELQRFAIAMSCIQKADVSADTLHLKKISKLSFLLQIHVRRTFQLPRYQAAVASSANYPIITHTRLLRRNRRARSCHPRLSLRLCLLSIR
jgi:ABC-type dipeptide/oligopeptide/nickel transport system ATPase subunit